MFPNAGDTSSKSGMPVRNGPKNLDHKALSCDIFCTQTWIFCDDYYRFTAESEGRRVFKNRSAGQLYSGTFFIELQWQWQWPVGCLCPTLVRGQSKRSTRRIDEIHRSMNEKIDTVDTRLHEHEVCSTVQHQRSNALQEN